MQVHRNRLAVTIGAALLLLAGGLGMSPAALAGHGHDSISISYSSHGGDYGRGSSHRYKHRRDDHDGYHATRHHPRRYWRDLAYYSGPRWGRHGGDHGGHHRKRHAGHSSHGYSRTYQRRHHD